MARNPQPTLITAIHTEEEFSWNEPFDRARTATTHTEHLAAVEKIFDRYGVEPTYVLGYPFTSSQAVIAAFRTAVNLERATIGAHLHPWVTPPYEEEISRINSYPGNLPAPLEEEKIRILTESIERAYGVRPRTYLAGRYGFGMNTAGILESLQYEVDLSASPPFDFSQDGGPNYFDSPFYPVFSGPKGSLLRIPHSGAAMGYLCNRGRPLVPAYQTLSPLAKGILSKTRAAAQIRLSPEGFSLADAVRLTQYLKSLGVWLFVYSFHSPSVAAGHTPYVKTQAELADFLGRIEGYMAYFSNEMGGRFAGAEKVRALMDPMQSQLLGNAGG